MYTSLKENSESSDIYRLILIYKNLGAGVNKYIERSYNCDFFSGWSRCPRDNKKIVGERNMRWRMGTTVGHTGIRVRFHRHRFHRL